MVLMVSTNGAKPQHHAKWCWGKLLTTFIRKAFYY